jgi:glycine cleavage system transcriptional repressor
MSHYIVVSAIGKDRPGFVNAISRELKQLGANIEIQRSTRMADEYALIMLASLAGGADQVERAVQALNGLRTDDLYVSARRGVAATGCADPAGFAEIEASGADQPGIIDAVTLLLFKRLISIETMDYDTESAPMTGESLFRMNARLAIPKGVDLPALREELRAMEKTWNFDVILRYPVD